MKKSVITLLAVAALGAVTPVFASEFAESENKWQDAWDKVANTNAPKPATPEAPKPATPEAPKPATPEVPTVFVDNPDSGYAKLGKDDPAAKATDNNTNAADAATAEKKYQDGVNKNTGGTQEWLKVAIKNREALQNYVAELKQQLKDVKNDPWSTQGAEAEIARVEALIKKLNYSIEKEEYFHWTGEDLDTLDVVTGKKAKPEAKAEDKKSDKPAAKKVEKAETKKGAKALPKTSAVK